MACRPPQRLERSERVFREYAELHAEVREWSKDAFESEAFMSDAFRSFGIFAASMTLRHFAISALM